MEPGQFVEAQARAESSPSISETGPSGRTLPSPKAGETANGRGGSSSIIGTGQEPGRLESGDKASHGNRGQPGNRNC